MQTLIINVPEKLHFFMLYFLDKKLPTSRNASSSSYLFNNDDSGSEEDEEDEEEEVFNQIDHSLN